MSCFSFTESIDFSKIGQKPLFKNPHFLLVPNTFYCVIIDRVAAGTVDR